MDNSTASALTVSTVTVEHQTLVFQIVVIAAQSIGHTMVPGTCWVKITSKIASKAMVASITAATNIKRFSLMHTRIMPQTAQITPLQHQWLTLHSQQVVWRWFEAPFRWCSPEQ